MKANDIMKLALGPFGLVILGGYLGYKYGNKATIKNRYVGAGAGAAAGYLTSRALSTVLGLTRAQQDAVQAAQPPQEQQSLDDYVPLSFDSPQALQALPAPSVPLMTPTPRMPVVGNNPANSWRGEGSLARSSYNTEDVEESVGEVEQDLISKGN